MERSHHRWHALNHQVWLMAFSIILAACTTAPKNTTQQQIEALCGTPIKWVENANEHSQIIVCRDSARLAIYNDSLKKWHDIQRQFCGQQGLKVAQETQQTYQFSCKGSGVVTLQK